MRFHLIGAGNLGKTLAYLFTQHGLTLCGVHCSRIESSLAAILEIGQGEAIACLEDLPPADLILIATPDKHIHQVVKTLSHRATLQPGCVVFHCSGILSSDDLQPLQNKQCSIASVHPLFSFSEFKRNIALYSGTYCAVEGDEQAQNVLIPIFADIGSVCFIIDKKAKSLYHAAAVFSSNYLMTLGQTAVQCMHQAGLDKDHAKKIVFSLMQQALLQFNQGACFADVLTGPLVRKDLNTIEKHLNVLKDENNALYQAMIQSTLKLLEQETA